MPSILNTLPGILLPVSEVSHKISDIWKKERGQDDTSHASQMNLILHFGIKTTPNEAKEYFDAAIRFSQRYPARLVVLCPNKEDSTKMKLEAKFFFQCYLGSSHRKRCCCEAFMLGYDPSESEHLKNQVSIWLQSDLPTYHWFYKVPAEKIKSDYLKFTRNAKRVVFDTTEDPEIASIEWERPYMSRDLADARLLTVKQSLGQFLSGYAPEDIANELQRVNIDFSTQMSGESSVLKNWIQDCLSDCSDKEIKIDTNHEKGSKGITIKFEYKQSTQKSFNWSFDNSNQEVSIRANIGKGNINFTQRLKLLDLDKALSEALFF
jgi:hypothetical protein